MEVVGLSLVLPLLEMRELCNDLILSWRLICFKIVKELLPCLLGIPVNTGSRLGRCGCHRLAHLRLGLLLNRFLLRSDHNTSCSFNLLEDTPGYRVLSRTDRSCVQSAVVFDWQEVYLGVGLLLVFVIEVRFL